MLYSFDQSPLNKNATDENLMARVQDRDEKALVELYRRHLTLLRNIIARIVNSEGDVDDLTQEVYLDIWNRAKNYSQEKGHALGWIVTIARRRAIDRLRRKMSYFRAQERMRMEPVHEMHQHIREEVNSSELTDIFNKIFSQLPTAQREVIHLCYYNSMSQREIAAMTGIPLGTIKTRLQLAMSKIRTAVLAFEDFRGWTPSQTTSAYSAVF
jgi:RNA polymerase sigma-70 factor (ECF subfamily)